MVEELGCKCREWPEGATDAAVESVIEDSRVDMVAFTDGAVRHGSKS